MTKVAKDPHPPLFCVLFRELTPQSSKVQRDPDVVKDAACPNGTKGPRRTAQPLEMMLSTWSLGQTEPSRGTITHEEDAGRVFPVRTM